MKISGSSFYLYKLGISIVLLNVVQGVSTALDTWIWGVMEMEKEANRLRNSISQPSITVFTFHIHPDLGPAFLLAVNLLTRNQGT